MTDSKPKEQRAATRRLRRAEGRRCAVSFDMQPALHRRMKQLVAVIRRDRGAAYGQSWYVQDCVRRCLALDCETWGIEDPIAEASQDRSQ